jgi:hypothetical protein
MFVLQVKGGWKKRMLNYYEAVSLNRKINAKKQLHHVLETKQTPNKNIESELCFDLKKKICFSLDKIIQKIKKSLKIISAWKVAENKIKWV